MSSQWHFGKNPKSKMKKEFYSLLFNWTLFIDALGHVSAAENVVFSNRVSSFIVFVCCHIYIWVFLIQSQNAPDFLEWWNVW